MSGEFETPDVDKGGDPPARPDGRRERSAPAPVPAAAAPDVPVGADAVQEPPGDEQPPPVEGGDNATRLSGRDAVITALGAASAVGSFLVAPAWIVLVTLAIFAVVLASLIPTRRRLLIPAAIMLVVAAGVVAQQTSQKSDASETPTQLVETPNAEQQVLERMKRLEDHIDALLRQQVESERDEIPIPDLVPIRAAMLEYINRLRDRRALPAVAHSVQLERAAQKHVREMSAGDYFDHSGRGGEAFDERIRREGNWRILGEVLAMYSLNGDSKDLTASWRESVEIWLRSPAHRSILLNDEFTHAGVGVDVGRFGDDRDRAALYTVDFGGR